MPIELPVLNQCYSCHSCGQCCRNYTVPVTTQERERIAAQGWEADPNFADTPLFVWNEARQDYALAQRADGACVFLDESGRCRIHARFGEATKPIGCRMYPFVFNQVDGRSFVSLRFDCPSVAGSQGVPVAEQRHELVQLAAEVVAERPEVALRFRKAEVLPETHLIAASQSLEWIIADGSLDLTRRVLACVTLTELLRRVDVQKVAALEAMREFLHLSADTAIAAAQADPLERRPPGRLPAMMFRQTLAMYARRDREQAGVRDKLAHVTGTLLGRGVVPPWQPGVPNVRFQDLEPSFGHPDDLATELLARNLRSKLGGLGFFGSAFHGFSLLEGLEALLLTYPVVLWFARMFAVSEQHTTLGRTAVQRALALVEGPWGRRPVFRLATERRRHAALCAHPHLRTLVVWYGT